MSDTLATAIVAVFNEERHIAECLESLLDQSYTALEIVVVDDGSTDGTADVVRRFRSVSLIERPHQSKARAINHAAREANGEILLFLDGDMYFDPRYVELLVAPILDGSAVGTCHGTELVANPENVWSRCLQDKSGVPRDRRLDLRPHELAEGSVVYRAVRTDSFRRVGGFDDTGYIDDQSLYPKLKQRAQFVPDAICYHYNAETLYEVFAAGSWGGKTIARRYGPRSMIRYTFPFSLLRAVGTAAGLSNPAILPHDLVYDAGVLYGMLRLYLGIDRHYGR